MADKVGVGGRRDLRLHEIYHFHLTNTTGVNKPYHLPINCYKLILYMK